MCPSPVLQRIGKIAESCIQEKDSFHKIHVLSLDMLQQITQSTDLLRNYKYCNVVNLTDMVTCYSGYTAHTHILLT